MKFKDFLEYSRWVFAIVAQLIIFTSLASKKFTDVIIFGWIPAPAHPWIGWAGIIVVILSTIYEIQN